MTFHHAEQYLDALPADLESDMVSDYFSALSLSAGLAGRSVIALNGNRTGIACARILEQVLTQAGISTGVFSPADATCYREMVRINRENLPMPTWTKAVKTLRAVGTAAAENERTKKKNAVFCDRADLSRGRALFLIACQLFAESDAKILLFCADEGENTYPAFLLPAHYVVLTDRNHPLPWGRETEQVIAGSCVDETAYRALSESCARYGCRLSLPAHNAFCCEHRSPLSCRFSYREAQHIRLATASVACRLGAMLAVETLEAVSRRFSIPLAALREGFAQTSFPCFFEILSIDPPVILDWQDGEDFEETCRDLQGLLPAATLDFTEQIGLPTENPHRLAGEKMPVPTAPLSFSPEVVSYVSLPHPRSLAAARICLCRNLAGK